LDGFCKCLLVLLCQLEQRLGQERSVEPFLQIVGQLPYDRLKLSAGQLGICICDVDSLVSFSAQLEGLRDAVRERLLFEERSTEIDREIRGVKAHLRVWTEPCSQFL